MLPLLRLLSIGIRMCTEPIISRIKIIAQAKAAGKLRYLLIKAGNRIHYYEVRINKRFLGIKDNEDIHSLSEEDALDKSCSFFLEVFVLYGIFFYWAINETLDSIESSRQMKEDLDNLKDSNNKFKGELLGYTKKIDEDGMMIERLKKEIFEIKEEMMKRKIEKEKSEEKFKEVFRGLNEKIMSFDKKY